MANAFDRPVESIISSYSPSSPSSLLPSVKKVTMLVVVVAAVWGPQLICQIMSRQQRGGSSNQREGANEAAFVKQLPALGRGRGRTKHCKAGEREGEEEPGRATQLCVVRPKKRKSKKGSPFAKSACRAQKPNNCGAATTTTRKRTTTT